MLGSGIDSQRLARAGGRRGTHLNIAVANGCLTEDREIPWRNSFRQKPCSTSLENEIRHRSATDVGTGSSLGKAIEVSFRPRSLDGSPVAEPLPPAEIPC